MDNFVDISIFENGIIKKSKTIQIEEGNWQASLSSLAINNIETNEHEKNRRFAWSPIVWDSNKKRAGYNFKHSDFLTLDIDDGITLKEAVSILEGFDILVLATKNHLKAKKVESVNEEKVNERFRIIIPFERRVTSLAEYKATMDKIKEVFPWADLSCLDPARVYWASKSILYKSSGGKKWKVAKPNEDDHRYEKAVLFGPSYNHESRFNKTEDKKALRKVQVRNGLNKSFFLIKNSGSIGGKKDYYQINYLERGIKYKKNADLPSIYLRKDGSSTWLWLPSASPVYYYDKENRKTIHERLRINNKGFLIFQGSKDYKYKNSDFKGIHHIPFRTNNNRLRILIPYNLKKEEGYVKKVKDLCESIRRVIYSRNKSINFCGFYTAISAIPKEIEALNKAKIKFNTQKLISKIKVDGLIDLSYISDKSVEEGDEIEKSILELKVELFSFRLKSEFKLKKMLEKKKIDSNLETVHHCGSFFKIFEGELPKLSFKLTKKEQIWLRFFLSNNKLFYKFRLDGNNLYIKDAYFKASVNLIYKYFKKYGVDACESTGRRLLSKLVKNNYLEIVEKEVFKKTSRKYRLTLDFYEKLIKSKMAINGDKICDFKIIIEDLISELNGQGKIDGFIRLIEPPTAGEWNDYIFKNVRNFRSFNDCLRYFEVNHGDFLYEKKERITQLKSAWDRYIAFRIDYIYKKKNKFNEIKNEITANQFGTDKKLNT